MICKNCNASLSDEALYCPVCGDKFAEREQKERVNSAFANTKDILVKKTKSYVFLAAAILFSVILASQATNMLGGGLPGIVSGILPFIFMLMTVIGMWTSYGAKSADKLVRSLRQASMFDAYTRVIHTIYIVLFSILGVVAVIGSFFLGLAGEKIASALGADEGLIELISSLGIVVAIVVLVVFAVIIAILAIFRGIYARRRKYFLELSDTAETCTYTVQKAPVVGSYVIGACDVFSAISSIGIALAAGPTIRNTLGDALAQMGLEGQVEALVATLTQSLTASGIGSAISGAYLILSAVWISSVHKAQVANKEEIMRCYASLEAVENATKEAIFEDARRMREESESEAESVEEEACEQPLELAVVEELTVAQAVAELEGAEKSSED